MTLLQFWDRLEAHDWYFEFSDDMSRWKHGTEDLEELEGISIISEAHREMYLEFEKHYSSGSEKVSKPARPVKAA